MLRSGKVYRVARRFGAAVDGEMFRGGNHAIVLRVIALHSCNERHAHAPGQKRIFAVGFLAASPARIAKDVDIRGPEVETLINSLVACFDGLIVFRARFSADYNSYDM